NDYCTRVPKLPSCWAAVVRHYGAPRAAGQDDRCRVTFAKEPMRFPWANWRATDGRAILVDRASEPIWQRLPSGVIEPADRNEWVDIRDSDFFFDPLERDR